MEMVNKLIRTKAEYEAALQRLQVLMESQPVSGSAEADALDLLGVLVRDYESKNFPGSLPSALEAIRFRMEQQHLTARDLIAYIGSRSKVSEVLSGKRSLTLSMIRALNQGLGIPARVLVQNDSRTTSPEAEELDWDKFPIKAMIRRGWLKASGSESQSSKDVLMKFFAPIASFESVHSLYRQSAKIRSARSMDLYALTAWTARAVTRATQNPLQKAFELGCVNERFMREVARLSCSDKGPILAKEYLEHHGIHLVIEPHLPRTYVDGAALLISAQTPIIALTLRYDRLDNFWYSLMHELAHLALHLGKSDMAFFDDLDAEDMKDPRESEADSFASEVLIPSDLWNRSTAKVLKSSEAAEHFARKLHVHPAIVAGRMRHERKNYKILNKLIGHGQVRQLFRKENLHWE
jgi:HTH-type transcriptional regulator / antitoxin HigA